ncbi:uncharacterized protein LOC132256226 [Phlebotomus argentipes]|uniref:uncharacterized protein LOC132256226 n=1 Tax=Phlebotomus argentipes TaxID=94469 RepID=UPI002892BD0E|nr:uncharacterized protein LOC132256226 [Phlebotomus argentipes]
MFNYWNVASGQQIPDLILDIGAPPSKRFAVHSSLVIHHSHYLRNLLEDCQEPEKTLYLPTISSEQFSILLNYMYTGFLDITAESVFSVLLAAHTLHMPKVLEICTSFMLQHQLRTEWNYMGAGTQASDGVRDIENIRQCVKIVKPIASKARKTDFNFISSPSACIFLPSASETPFRAVSNTLLPPSEEDRTTKSPPGCLRDRNTPTNSPQGDDSTTKSDNPNSSRAIVDIASCDGPVRFRRVLNLAIFTDSSSSSPRRDSEESQEMPIFRRTAPKKPSKPTATSQQNSEIFSCLHCKHTFRSQYCYLKHAKRHLYPPETTSQPQSPHQLPSVSPKAPEESTQSTNVQYYPCKICGCKFPSYYFVHKHRKMCHRNTHEE